MTDVAKRAVTWGTLGAVVLALLGILATYGTLAVKAGQIQDAITAAVDHGNQLQVRVDDHERKLADLDKRVAIDEQIAAEVHDAIQKIESHLEHLDRQQTTPTDKPR